MEKRYATFVQEHDEHMKLYKLRNRIFHEKETPYGIRFFEMIANLERDTFPFGTTTEIIKDVSFEIPDYQVVILLKFNALWYDNETNRFSFLIYPGNIIKEDEVYNMMATELTGEDKIALAERICLIAEHI